MIQRLLENQSEIYVVNRKVVHDGWSRTLIDEASIVTPFNHRLILDCELVYEFNEEDSERNAYLAEQVCAELDYMNYSYSVWSSGGKSTHIHIFFLNMHLEKDPQHFKKWLFHRLVRDTELKPDAQLANPNHLVRAENGLHERTQRRKTLVKEVGCHGDLNSIDPFVRAEYKKYIKDTKLKPVFIADNSLLSNHWFIKELLDTDKFKHRDGKKRALFILGQVFKDKFDSVHKLSHFLTEWYRAVGGGEMSPKAIHNFAEYHYKKHYSLSTYTLDNYAKELGLSKPL